MKLDIVSLSKNQAGKKELPSQFNELIRPDLIKRAVEAIQANKRQPYGAKPEAGKRSVSWISKRRRDYKGCYGHGISRTPRKILSRRGTQFNWVGAFAPGTIGGRRAHPPKSSTIRLRKVNKKENRKAIRSAMAATMVRAIVEKRGHHIPKDYPFIVENKIEDLGKTKLVQLCLTRLGFTEELQRTSDIRIRAGKGKFRGRRYRTKKGPLIVVSKKCNLMFAARGIPGVDVVEVRNLNAESLAPGAHIGRLTIFTDSAIDVLAKEGLFTRYYKGSNTTQKTKDEKEAKFIEMKKAAEAKAIAGSSKNKTKKSEKSESQKKEKPKTAAKAKK